MEGTLRRKGVGIDRGLVHCVEEADILHIQIGSANQTAVGMEEIKTKIIDCVGIGVIIGDLAQIHNSDMPFSVGDIVKHQTIRTAVGAGLH
jgi:hypothetical protein